MNINWDAITHEMKMMTFIKEFLELDDCPEMAVMVAAKVNASGNLTQAMEDDILTMRFDIEDDEDEEGGDVE